MCNAIRCLATVMVVLIGADGPAHANLCEEAADAVAAQMGVPLTILQVISLAESGKSRRDGTTVAWPWTVHANGQGHWFARASDAISAVEHLISMGETNIDIGCFQLNYRWHGDKFESIAQMFDPRQNARIAAKFLYDLHREQGDWRRAAGTYHSRSSFKAGHYVARLEQIYSGLPSAGQVPEPQDQIRQSAPQGLTMPSGPLIVFRVTPLIRVVR